MKAVSMLVKMMDEELEDACGYGKEALFYKDSDKELGDMFLKLATQELEHADLEHAQAVRLIKLKNVEPPAAMKAVWEWEHERYIEHALEIKTMLAMYKQ